MCLTVYRVGDSRRQNKRVPEHSGRVHIEHINCYKCVLLYTESETFLDKIKGFLNTAGAFISSILVSLTRHLMKYSRDYRYVSRTLSVEKKRLKVRAIDINTHTINSLFYSLFYPKISPCKETQILI